jgi:hypothetical protein
VIARKQKAVRIALGGIYLEEVQIRHAMPYQPGYVSYLSFPANRHWASVTKERVTVSAQAPSVVQLYATGILPPIGSRAIALEVDGKPLGDWVLDSVESGATSAVDDMIVLHFHEVPEGTP